MIEGLKAYAEYKVSGLPWLERVPAHWRVYRNGNLFAQRNEIGYGELPILEVSLNTGVRVRDFSRLARKQIMSDLEKYKRALKGDAAYNMMRMWQGAVGVSPVDGLVSPAYVVLRPYPGVDSRFYAALFRTGVYMAEVDSCSRGIVKDRNRLYWSQFKQMPSLYMPPDEQAAIVRFLDHANWKIDGFIRAKRKLIGLLNEQKQAIIHQAVTRGLNPDVPLKPSGISWLGNIPEHWEVKKLRLLFRYAKGGRAAELTNEYIGQNSGPYAVFSGQTESGGLMGRINWYEFDFSSPVIFVSTVGARAMTTRILSGKFSLSQNCAILITRSNFTNPIFFENVFQRLFSFERHSISQIMQPSLRFADLNRFYVPHPPINEQYQIGNEIERKSQKLNTITALTEQEIALMQEYRTRLTADIVTGKLDVREAAAKLPEVDGAVDLPDGSDKSDRSEMSDLSDNPGDPEEEA